MLSTATRERRIFDRRNCRIDIACDDFEQCYAGTLTNISLGGAFIETERQHQIGDEMVLTIPFNSRSDFLVISAQIIWRDPNGVGLRFSSAPETVH